MTRFHYSNTKDVDMRYLIQHTIADPFFFLERDGQKIIWLSALDIGAFNASQQSATVTARSLEKLIDVFGSNDLVTLALAALEEVPKTEDVIVSDHLPVTIFKALSNAGYRVSVQSPFVPERLCKSTTEVAAIEAVQETVVAAFVYLENLLKEANIENAAIVHNGNTVTSQYLKNEIEQFLFRRGMWCTEGIIISSGAEAAMPHHSGSGAIQPGETIICDIFPQDKASGYFGDMTRTYVKGEPSEEQKQMYTAVYSAQQACIEAVHPGVSARTLYDISAKYIQNAGYSVGKSENREGYIHSLGHGVGLEIHEAPHLSRRSREVLEPGMVITIEPGLYYAAHGGVRIEDTGVVTDSGFRNLTNHHYDWIIP